MLTIAARSESWLGVDWNAVVAIGTTVAAVAALFAVLQTRRRSRETADAARADVFAWIETDYGSNELRARLPLTIKVRNDSRSQVKIEMIVLRPRFLHFASLIDPADALYIGFLRSRDPLSWLPDGRPLSGSGTEKEFSVSASDFDHWSLGDQKIFDEAKIPHTEVSPWVENIVVALVFSDNTGQTWARLQSGRLKKISGTYTLFARPLKRLIPDHS